MSAATPGRVEQKARGGAPKAGRIVLYVRPSITMSDDVAADNRPRCLMGSIIPSLRFARCLQYRET